MDDWEFEALDEITERAQIISTGITESGHFDLEPVYSSEETGDVVILCPESVPEITFSADAPIQDVLVESDTPQIDFTTEIPAIIIENPGSAYIYVGREEYPCLTEYIGTRWKEYYSNGGNPETWTETSGHLTLDNDRYYFYNSGTNWERIKNVGTIPTTTNMTSGEWIFPIEYTPTNWARFLYYEIQLKVNNIIITLTFDYANGLMNPININIYGILYGEYQYYEEDTDITIDTINEIKVIKRNGFTRIIFGDFDKTFIDNLSSTIQCEATYKSTLGGVTGTYICDYYIGPISYESNEGIDFSVPTISGAGYWVKNDTILVSAGEDYYDVKNNANGILPFTTNTPSSWSLSGSLGSKYLTVLSSGDLIVPRYDKEYIEYSLIFEFDDGDNYTELQMFPVCGYVDGVTDPIRREAIAVTKPGSYFLVRFKMANGNYTSSYYIPYSSGLHTLKASVTESTLSYYFDNTFIGSLVYTNFETRFGIDVNEFFSYIYVDFGEGDSLKIHEVSANYSSGECSFSADEPTLVTVLAPDTNVIVNREPGSIEFSMIPPGVDTLIEAETIEGISFETDSPAIGTGSGVLAVTPEVTYSGYDMTIWTNSYVVRPPATPKVTFSANKPKQEWLGDDEIVEPFENPLVRARHHPMRKNQHLY